MSDNASGDLTSADLMSLGIGGGGDSTVEPSSTPTPKNPDGVGVPDTGGVEPQTPAPTPVTPSPTPAPTLEDDNPVAKLAAKRGVQSRDYSGLDENEKKLFEKMGNDSYRELYPIYKDYKANKDRYAKLPELEKELETLKQAANGPKLYYDHPDSYLLSDEYREALYTKSQLSEVEGFWRSQLEKLEAGQPFQVLQTGLDGNLTLSQPVDPKAPNARVYLNERFMRASQDLAAHEGKMQQLVGNIRAKHGSYTKTVDNLFTTYFGKYTDELKPGADKFLSRFPKDIAARPEVKFAAYALSALAQSVETAGEAQKQVTAAAANNKAQQRAGPTAAAIQSGVTGKAGFNDAEYNQFKGEFGL